MNINKIIVPDSSVEGLTYKDGKVLSQKVNDKLHVFLFHEEDEEGNVRAMECVIDEPLRKDKVILAAEKSAYDLLTADDVMAHANSLAMASRSGDKAGKVAERDAFIADVEKECVSLGIIDDGQDIDAKKMKIAEIEDYDKSSAVNEFTLGGNAMWLPLEERKSMRQSLIALKAKGIEEFTYWNDLTPITMPVAQFEAIMDAVEVYALQCFNVTAQHKANVMALESLEEVNAYNFTTGYPDKLAF